MTPRPKPPDQDQRSAAIAARGVNVVVDAGAGTGKTTLLVDRLVEMVAPAGGGEEVPLSEIAAITFTRKAAGELKLRIREKLLAELAAAPAEPRRGRLARALGDADTAFVGTIHSFADRLLRRHPVESRLSPSYEIVEEAEALHAEAFELLLQAADAGRLAEELAGTACTAEQVGWAEEALSLAVDAHLRFETSEGAWADKVGLDRLLAGFVEHRDAPPAFPPPAPFERLEVVEPLEEFLALARASRGPGAGPRWIAATAKQVAAIAKRTDPAAMYRGLAEIAAGKPKLQMRRDFGDDRAGWKAWKGWTEGIDEGPALLDAALAPLRRWLGTRLVRLQPAAVAAYEKVKARHRAVDQVDLLLKLRDLLRDHPAVRRDLQGLFRHLFVDEAQDTDPLQAEIVLFLCEDGARASRWDEVALAPGRLTVVGDPKQSIYRFRRADIAVYEAVRESIRRGPHLVATLTANFRTAPALLAHLNDRHDALLGVADPALPPFDAEAGTVANVPLLPGRGGGCERPVVVLPIASAEGKAAPERALEARALALWIRRTVEARSAPILDPADGRTRPAGYGDVAVLAHATSHVGLLVAELDRLGVPWSARGGTLFLADPLHRRFLLALRAVADRDDGVAQAALLRAPFFDVDHAGLARERVAPPDSTDPGVVRVRAARALVQALRRDRLARPPGETARDLLDRTGLARAIAFGPNGAQRLERLRELCLEVERLAAADGLDYDGVTARLRALAIEPAKLDPPRPVGTDAVQIMTIHQAKGLEFPVVAWWDGHAKLAPRGRQAAWFVSRDGTRWAMEIEGLTCEEPAENGLLARELVYLAAERKRLVYVAATRARDLLLLPESAGLGRRGVTPALIGPEDAPAVERLEPFTDAAVPAWALGVEPPPARRPAAAAGLAEEADRAWGAAIERAGRRRAVPTGVSTEAHRVAEADREGDAGAWWKARKGRFGPVFGDTVHAAIGAALRDPALDAAAAVAREARSTGLDVHLEDAAADVARALAALEREGLRRPPDASLRLEYPVAHARDGLLLVGYVDLLAIRGDELLVVDFKTDAPPAGDVAASHPDYVEQVRSYGRILGDLGLAAGRTVRGALLFTGDGLLRWIG